MRTTIVGAETPFNVHTATNQDIYDFVCDHLYRQGKRAWHGGIFTCAYRAPDGTTCAVGCILPDAQYLPNMESQSIEVIAQSFNLSWALDSERNPDRTKLLWRLQTIHDSDHSWSTSGEMAHRLTELALEFGLNPAKANQTFADGR